LICALAYGQRAGCAPLSPAHNNNRLCT
jgi:hypothetical protein